MNTTSQISFMDTHAQSHTHISDILYGHTHTHTLTN
jgi:hypothetical protein